MNLYALFKKRKATPHELTPVEIQPPPPQKNHPEYSEWFFVS
jgi:hypothetical protein